MWRPPNWKIPRFFKHALYRTPQLETVYEAGADTMHKADVKWLMSFGEKFIFLLKSRMTKEEWERFTEGTS